MLVILLVVAFLANGEVSVSSRVTDGNEACLKQLALVAAMAKASPDVTIQAACIRLGPEPGEPA